MRFVLLLIIILGGFPVQAQVKKFSAREIEAAFARVTDTFYACRYETSNKEYNFFLADMAKKDSVLYRKYQVDSLCWLEKGDWSLINYYHRHLGFNDYPAVGMEYASAVAYCNWLTGLYNNDPGRKFRKVVFVLPSEQEWEQAARGNNSNSVFPWGTLSLRQTRKGSWQGIFLANYKHFGESQIARDTGGKPFILKEVDPFEKSVITGLNDRAFYTAPVNSFFPNNLGIYNQSGNVAEMTNQEGLTKGGSWDSYGGELLINYKLVFYKPSAEVGFRVFMKILEK